MSALYHLVCFLAGGLYGWIGDGGHVLTGVLDYPKKDHLLWPGLAWWVVPQFATGGLVLSLVVHQAARRTKQYTLPKDFPSYTRSVVATVLSLVTYLLSSVLSWHQVDQFTISLTLAALTFALAIFLQLHQRSLVTIILIGVLAFGGGVAWESSLCAIGVFRYIQPDQGLYVNHWIGWLWIGAVLSAATVMWRYENSQPKKVEKKSR